MQDIDIVVTWVDGNDPQWLKQRAAYSGTPLELSDVRFRDWDLMRYWFRGIEKYAPWARKIHFVTWGHLPQWLDTTNPKLHIVRHEDFIPKEYLPTFNSHTIELNLHRIEGLAEQFIYFNDDMFLTNYMEPTQFFKNGLPRDCFGLDAIFFGKDSIGLINGSNMSVLNDHFRMRSAFKKNWRKWLNPVNGPKKVIKTCAMALFYEWFPGMYYWHLTGSYLKSTFDTVWEKEPQTLSETCSCKFRQQTNVSPFLMKFWQMAEGNFIPMSNKCGWCFHMRDTRVDSACSAIRNQTYDLICINDTGLLGDWQTAAQEVRKSFETLFPEKSGFEKE